jgi:hypothetical protein
VSCYSAKQLKPLFVEGIGFWTPQVPNWLTAQSIFNGSAMPSTITAQRPAPSLLPAAERRRACDTVAVALEVAAQACEQAQCAPNDLPSVFVSTHGDLAISDSLCATLAQEPHLLSPTKFHNSVHNAAAGYWTIGTQCLAPYTALSAYIYSFASGFVESATQALADNTTVLLVAYDIEACGPLQTMQPSRGVFSTALILSPQQTARSIAQLQWSIAATAGAVSQARAGNAALVAGNAMADCVVVFEALADKCANIVRLALSPFQTLTLDIEPL